jgi:predicted acyltransferase
MQRLLGLGAIALAIGLLWSDGFPVNRPLWTGSFVMLTTGWVCMTFIACIYLCELKQAQKWLFPLKVCGMNSLAIYVMTSLFTYTLQHVRTLSGVSLKVWLYEHIYAAVLGDNMWASLAYALVFLIFTCLFAFVLYRQRVFFKL